MDDMPVLRRVHKHSHFHYAHSTPFPPSSPATHPSSQPAHSHPSAHAHRKSQNHMCECESVCVCARHGILELAGQTNKRPAFPLPKHPSALWVLSRRAPVSACRPLAAVRKTSGWWCLRTPYGLCYKCVCLSYAVYVRMWCACLALPLTCDIWSAWVGLVLYGQGA